jgi:O-antigen/teichoic acid export membrane protein
MAICTWSFVRVNLRRFDLSYTKTALKHVRKSYVLTLAKGASAITQQLPVVVLSMVFPVVAYSGFALLHRVVLSSNLIFVSLGMAVFPRFVQRAREDYDKAWRSSHKLMGYIIIMVLPVVAVLLSLTQIPQIHQKFFPDVSLLAAVSMLAYLAVRSVRIVPMRFLIASERQDKALKGSGFGCLLFMFILLICWLTLGITIELVALGFLVTEIVIIVIMLFFCRKGQDKEIAQ